MPSNSTPAGATPSVTPPPAGGHQAAKASKASTQDSLIIAEIRDDIVVMRDGSLRAVIIGSAINFDLMSTSERDSVEYAYQNFLNSLHFPIQILVKSQKIDLDGYIGRLQQLRTDQDNDLLALLMDDYIANIKALIEEVNIMDKQFYIVVPYFPPVMDSMKTKNVATGLAGVFRKQAVTTLGENDFTTYKTELSQRVQLVSSGLGQIGVRNIPLNTQELIDLYYSSYNPDTAQNQKLVDAAQLQTAAVTKGQGDAPTQLASGGPF
jgi:type IV secretory pathway VirB4 component